MLKFLLTPLVRGHSLTPAMQDGRGASRAGVEPHKDGLPRMGRLGRVLHSEKKPKAHVTDVCTVDSAVETMTSPGLNHLIYFL